MDTSTPITTIGAALVIAVILTWLVKRISAKKYKFPPRVPGIPFFGNTFQLGVFQQGQWAQKQARKYGEMFTCTIGGNQWVFLNSTRVVYDLLDRRAAIYSSRPEQPMTQEIMSGGNRIVMMAYGERWRAVRKVMHQILNIRSKDLYKDFQELESIQLLHEYLQTPEKWYLSNQRYSNAVMLSVVFGRRAQLDDPQIAELFATSNEFLENLQPGYNLVDGYPQLAKLPQFLQWWRPRGERAYHRTISVYRREVNRLKESVKKGTAKPCFGVDFLKAAEHSDFDEAQKLFTLGSLLEAGSDTSRITVSQVLAAAATYPDWVERAREQLDRVCGYNAERLPTLDDRDELPYMTAVTKEAFRWRPFAEIGVPHVLTQDDEYEGYKFPAGTVFTWNAYAIALNPDEYDQPERFWPERFMNDDLNSPLKGHYAFGAGRRICAGYNVGETNVWIVAARLLYCFDFKENPGKPIDTFGAPWQRHDAPPVHVDISPRSHQHAALIERAFKAAFADGL